MLPEILLIDKPVGITSFDVIRQLRRLTGVKKFGHAGTLDPLASGLMVIGVERGTKQLTALTKLDKEYVAEICLGRSTTTGDREGEVVAEQLLTEPISQAVMQATLLGMCDSLTLPVSGYSAIKVAGVPMYKRARAAARSGQEIPNVPERTMHVFEAEVLHRDEWPQLLDSCQLVTVRFRVGSGTYIRSLAEELGQRLGGYPAHLTALRRTKVGDFTLAEARTLSSFGRET